MLDFTSCDESYLDSEYEAPVDVDSDGFYGNAPQSSWYYDCDDSHPGVTSDCIDNDGDGYYANVDDCDDGDYNVHENCEEYYCTVILGLNWYEGICYTPILIGSNALTSLTSAQDGVMFDIVGDGVQRQIAWTRAGTQAGWLAMDRNGNGLIDSGVELFGNVSPQAPSRFPHGFKALAELDANGDGWIDARDPAYRDLLLWRDTNHDGVSQSAELRPIAREGLRRISLRFQRSRLRDSHGNIFRLRAPILDDRNRDLGRFAWDVWLTSVPRQQ